jgi:hypothetical protein
MEDISSGKVSVSIKHFINNNVHTYLKIDKIEINEFGIFIDADLDNMEYQDILKLGRGRQGWGNYLEYILGIKTDKWLRWNSVECSYDDWIDNLEFKAILRLHTLKGR